MYEKMPKKSQNTLRFLSTIFKTDFTKSENRRRPFGKRMQVCFPMGWTSVIPWEEKCFLSAKGRFQQSVFTLFFIQTQQGTEETFSVMHLLHMHIHYLGLF